MQLIGCSLSATLWRENRRTAKSTRTLGQHKLSKLNARKTMIEKVRIIGPWISIADPRSARLASPRHLFASLRSRRGLRWLTRGRGRTRSVLALEASRRGQSQPGLAARWRRCRRRSRPGQSRKNTASWHSIHEPVAVRKDSPLLGHHTLYHLHTAIISP